MSLDTMSAEELLKIAESILEPSELEQALTNKLAEVKLELENASTALSNVMTVIDNATDM